MNTVCRLITLSEAEKMQTYPIDPQPGDMWYCQEYITRWPEDLSKYYKEHNSHRPPLMIILPGGYWWMLDGMACENGKTYGEGWQVIGEPPKLTVYPSIHLVGRWHGHLTDGVLIG